MYHIDVGPNNNTNYVSYATCLVPGQPVPMFTPVMLKSNGGNYFGGSYANTASIFEYSN